LVEGFQCQFGPGAAGDLGDGEEGTPVVAETIERGGRHGRLAGFEGGEVVGGPASEFAAKFGFDFDVLIIKAGEFVAGLGFDERDDDGTVVQSTGELADTGQGGGTEGAEGTDGISFAIATVGTGTAFMAGIEEAAKFLGLRQPGVHFVEEQRGLVLVDQAEEDGSGQVFGAESTGREGGDDIEDGGFAAARFGRGDVKARALDESGEAVGVGVPKGESLGGPGRKNEIMTEAVGDLCQESCAVDRFGPFKWGMQSAECGVEGFIIANLVAEAGDFGVESFDADAKLAGGFFSGAVVVHGRKGCEGAEGGDVG